MPQAMAAMVSEHIKALKKWIYIKDGVVEEIRPYNVS